RPCAPTIGISTQIVLPATHYPLHGPTIDAPVDVLCSSEAITWRLDSWQSPSIRHRGALRSAAVLDDSNRTANRGAHRSRAKGSHVIATNTRRLLALSALPLLSTGCGNVFGGSQSSGGTTPTVDAAVENSKAMILEGRETFRFETFGDEAFWGDTLRLHEAIAG